MSVTDLGNGIARIRVPVPFSGLDWVNVYVVADGDQAVLIDGGVDSDEGYSAIRGGLEALGRPIESIHSMVVTHLHPDHVGIAPRLRSLHDIDLVMHRNTAGSLPFYNRPEAWGPAFAGIARDHGAPREFWESRLAPSEVPVWWNRVDQPDHAVDDLDRIGIGPDRHLRVLHTPGHEVTHICLVDSTTGSLFSGDHVLPRITPHVGFDHPDLAPDPLADFLASLARVRDGGYTTTYPAHGDVLERGGARADQIIVHHERRLADTLREIGHPATAWAVTAKLFRPNLEPSHQRLALRETLAHLERLRLDGKAEQVVEDGTVQYVATR